jgi:hypothetical protein
MSKKFQLLALSLVSGLFLVVAFGVSGQSSGEKDSAKPVVTQWEYMVVGGGLVNLTGVSDLGQRKTPDDSFRENSVLQRNLDKLGLKGWELVAVQSTQRETLYYLKRPKEAR